MRRGPLPRSFHARDAVTVARELLGMHLVVERGGARLAGRIVETEAYVGPHDLACHAARGLTPRTRTMYGPPGHAYVYFIYGMHHCFNVVCEREGYPAAVLVRALEPDPGLDARTDGPGRLCAALGITRDDNGADLVRGAVRIERRGEPAAHIVRAPRIGVNYAGEWAPQPLRFLDADSAWVSRPPPPPAGRRRARS